MKTEGVCSVAFKERDTQEVTLAADSSVVVPYTIVPLVVGKLPLEVVVVARNMMGSDRVQKFLRVVVSLQGLVRVFQRFCCENRLAISLLVIGFMIVNLQGYSHLCSYKLV